MSEAQFPQDFIWYAQEGIGKIVSEFDETGAEHEFSEVNKSKTDFFGLKSKTLDFHYETETGEFLLMGQRFQLRPVINGEEVKTTGSKDPITYKRAFARFDPMSGEAGGSTIAEYYFGYKTLLLTNRGKVHLKVIVSLPVYEEAIRLAVHISADETPINGNVSLVVGEQPFESDAFSLAPQEAFDYQWTLVLS